MIFKIKQNKKFLMNPLHQLTLEKDERKSNRIK